VVPVYGFVLHELKARGRGRRELRERCDEFERGDVFLQRGEEKGLHVGIFVVYEGVSLGIGGGSHGLYFAVFSNWT
jgi:hypothetical protein